MHSHAWVWEEYEDYKIRDEKNHRFFPIHSVLKACKSHMSYCSHFERLGGYKRLVLILSSGINAKLILSQVIHSCNAVLFLHCTVQPFSCSFFQPIVPFYAPLKSWSSSWISRSLFGWGISSLPAVQYPEQGPNLLLELTSSRPLGSCKSHHRHFMIFLVLFYSENPSAQGYQIWGVSFLCENTNPNS